MKNNYFLTFGKLFLLLFLVTVFSSPILRSQSIDTPYDRNTDGFSDDIKTGFIASMLSITPAGSPA